MAFLGDEVMSSDLTTALCMRTPNGWWVSWRTGRLVDRNGAVSAIMIAESVAAGVGPGHRMWTQVCHWLAELGLTEADLPTGGGSW